MNDLIKIFLVEDDIEDIQIIEEMLKIQKQFKFHFEFDTTLAGSIKKLKEQKFDVILCDLGLPDSFGLGGPLSLNNEFPDIPLIVLSGSSDEVNCIQAVANGAQDYLVKNEIKIDTFCRSILYAIERKNAQKALAKSEAKYRNLAEQLAKTNELKELLIDVITHDLKNSSSGIYSFISLVVGQEQDKEMIDYIKLLSQRLIETISNASTLSKVTSGEDIQKQKIDLNEITCEITEEFSHLFQSANIKVDLKINGQLFIEANPIISEVVKNYLSNAIKYAPDGEKIIVETGKVNGKIFLMVKDFGEQIPEQKREVIFERNVRLKNDEKSGSGFGLAIVKRIAGAHNAIVEVVPNESKGNIFSIYFEPFEY